MARRPLPLNPRALCTALPRRPRGSVEIILGTWQPWDSSRFFHGRTATQHWPRPLQALERTAPLVSYPALLPIQMRPPLSMETFVILQGPEQPIPLTAHYWSLVLLRMGRIKTPL